MRSIGLVRPQKNRSGRRLAVPDLETRRNVMMHVSNQAMQSRSRVNEIVADVLSTTILVLTGIIAVAQFAYY
jgi:hypothetical protein